MGLEGHDHPLVIQLPGGGQQGVELVGVVGVVIVDLRAVVSAFMLKPAAGTGEGGQAFLHGFAGQTQRISCGGSGQGVENIVVAVDLEGDVGVFLTANHHIEGGAAIGLAQIGGGAVVGVVQTKGEHRVGKARHGVQGALVVGVDDDGALGGYQLSEPVEGVLDVVQVLEEVQVVGFHVQNHRHRGEEAQKAVAVFAGLQDDGVAMAHPVAGVEQGQGAADHDGGVGFGGHEDVGAHGSCGGLTVGAGDAQSVGVALHDGAPGLGPLVDGDAPCHGAGDLGIAVVDGGGADHKVAVSQVLRVVADGHGDAQGPQVLHRVALRHVGALDCQAHTPQYLCQGTHGHAADAHQVDPFAGHDIVTDGIGIVHHGNGLPFKNACRLHWRKKRCIIISTSL